MTAAAKPASSHFLRDLWALLHPFWRSEERWAGTALLAADIGASIGLTYIGVRYNEWTGSFYNAFQNHDLASFTHLLIVWFGLTAVLMALVVGGYYVEQMLQLRWRNWMTRWLMEQWLTDQAFWRSQLSRQTPDNPDQRIAEDVALFVKQTVGLVVGFVHALLGLGAYAAILWRLSANLQFFGWHIPGFLLWASILYCGTGTVFTHLTGRRLAALNFLHQRFEADFRFGLVRVRENAPSIALFGGGAEERRGLERLLRAVVNNWSVIVVRQTVVTGVKRVIGQCSNVFSSILMAPSYFAGGLPWGSLMQAQSAFWQIGLSLDWFMANYLDLVVWKATVDRLMEFRRTLRDANSSTFSRRSPKSESAVVIDHVTLRRPDGSVLIRNLALTFPRGSRTVIFGPTGCGKSTLLGAIAGTWPYGEGTISIPQDVRMLFLPQRAYVPQGTLCQALTYPMPADFFGRDRVEDFLRACGLEGLSGRLDETAPWGQSLSPGEMQRLNFVRTLLIRPDYLFMDEATSALDEESESLLYRLLVAQLPNMAIISIAHRSTVKKYHDKIVNWSGAHRILP